MYLKCVLGRKALRKYPERPRDVLLAWLPHTQIYVIIYDFIYDIWHIWIHKWHMTHVNSYMSYDINEFINVHTYVMHLSVWSPGYPPWAYLGILTQLSFKTQGLWHKWYWGFLTCTFYSSGCLTIVWWDLQWNFTWF